MTAWSAPIETHPLPDPKVREDVKTAPVLTVIEDPLPEPDPGRAPLMEETDDGRLITKRPTKKFSDLFKKNKKLGGSYSDLEKKGRGRGKF